MPECGSAIACVGIVPTRSKVSFFLCLLHLETPSPGPGSDVALGKPIAIVSYGRRDGEHPV